jgi:thiol-disulfide isomerase/thioredoxin
MLSIFRSSGAGRKMMMTHSRSFSNFIAPGDNAAFEALKVMDKKKVLYFTASWCPPCKIIGPIVEKMAKANPEITFVKIDIDDLPEAAAYGNKNETTLINSNDVCLFVCDVCVFVGNVCIWV